MSNQGEADSLRKWDTLLRLYFNCEPDTMNDETWAQRVNELKWALSKGHPYFTQRGNKQEWPKK